MQNRLPEIMGFNKTSEAGFNLFATSVFLFGCNLRCPYCMNGRIVVVKPEDWEKPVKTVDLAVVKAHVLESKTEWVMISGGEPTITPLDKLTNLIDEIRSWGCKVGMSTNGTRPEILEQILPKLSYVALDIKSGLARDYTTLDIKYKDESFERMLKSKGLLDKTKEERSEFLYEIRTTLYPVWVTMETIDEIGSFLNGKETWVLQQFRHAKDMLYDKEARQVAPYGQSILKEFASRAERYAERVIIRYV